MRTNEKSADQPARGVVTASPGPEQAPLSRRRPGIKIVFVAIAVVVLAGVGLRLWAYPGPSDDAKFIETAPVKRGDLIISVTEGGALRATESLELKCEVEGGRRTITKLVDEGTVITEEDVENELVLVELDSSDLEERKGSREISYYNSEAAYKKTVEDLAIQEKQNESNIALAKLDVKFTLMELERYLGKALAAELLSQEPDFSNLVRFASIEAENILETERAREVLGDVFVAASERVVGPQWGGEARQDVRSLASQVLLKGAELSNQEDKLVYTKQLAKEGYVGKNELRSDELRRDRLEVEKKSSEEELRLFVLYTLPKEAELRYSDWKEARRNLERVEARARSEVAQAKAELNSRKLSFQLDDERLKKLVNNVAKCIIKAPKAGRVVYAGTGHRWRRQQIGEGESVYYNQTILTIPDLSTLAAGVNIHETDIEKMKVGQPAVISLEALPGKSFKGRVARISPVANAAQSWLNPDIKVYDCDVSLEEIPEVVTPGMSATAEIVIAELKNVLYIPIQAVTTYGGQRMCWVKTPHGPERRPIQTGHFTEESVEIKGGLAEGESVYLRPPEELPEERTEAAMASRFASLLGEMPAEEPTQEQVEPAPPTDAPEEAEEPEGPAEPAAQADTEDQAGSEYVVDGELNWSKIRAETRGLSEEERAKKLEEIRQKLPPEQREQLEQRRRPGQPGERGGRRGGT